MKQDIWGFTCNNITCHGGNNATWGQTPFGCENCHGGATDVDDWNINNGTVSMIANGDDWNLRGHGGAERRQRGF